MATFSARRDINWAAVSKTSEISPEVQDHLKSVFATLAASIFFAGVGSIVYLKTLIATGFLTTLASIGLIIWISISPREEVAKRLALLFTFAFVTGFSVGPLLDLAIDVDPTLITNAFMTTVCVFGSFAGAAYYSQRRSWLYLGGFLGSALSTMVMLSFMNFFFRSMFIHNIMLYGGLLVFCGFVMFDTQLIIERASSGYKDVVSDSLELFLDFVNIFVRILIILLKDKKKERR